MTVPVLNPKRYFTVVFEGDIAKFPGNPLHAETPFGKPLAVGRDNAFDVIDEMERKYDGAPIKYASYECQHCGDAIGWIGRFFQFIGVPLHQCGV